MNGLRKSLDPGFIARLDEVGLLVHEENLHRSDRQHEQQQSDKAGIPVAPPQKCRCRWRAPAHHDGLRGADVWTQVRSDRGRFGLLLRYAHLRHARRKEVGNANGEAKSDKLRPLFAVLKDRASRGARGGSCTAIGHDMTRSFFLMGLMALIPRPIPP